MSGSMRATLCRCNIFTVGKILLNFIKSIVKLKHFFVDNSNTSVTYWLKPAVKEEGVKLYMGNHTFSYVAVDDFKNKAKCNFTISVIDKTPPIIENCVTEQIVFISSIVNSDVFVQWDEPSGYDNVDDRNITVKKDLEFGFLNEGHYQITYKLKDKSGNANKCLVHLEVKGI